ncbi:translation initiation factor IF-2-like [Penaeus monodon]|uniref:translation initiation factor IF-2-like n=1 Tax=Penaeus monodon TaxID=6687 RepID=UPI0018A72DAD|nr:translation initiation factor IF-2-like [Penaeus monodon]
MQEFDSQVKALVDSRVATDEALLIYALVAARLQLRLFRQEELEARLASLQEQRSQAESREEQMAEEEETTRREEARAKAKQERLQDQLKEEETALRRTIINLPIDQYNHLLALYNKRTLPSSRYLDLPSARGHHGGGETPSAAPPLSPTGGGPLSPSGVSPAPSESGASGRRGSTRPSRPASGASHTDELR